MLSHDFIAGRRFIEVLWPDLSMDREQLSIVKQQIGFKCAASCQLGKSAAHLVWLSSLPLNTDLPSVVRMHKSFLTVRQIVLHASGSQWFACRCVAHHQSAFCSVAGRRKLEPS